VRSLVLTADVPELDAGEVYARLADTASYPAHSDAIRSVVVTPVDDDTAVSHWEVNFRGGVLRWSEQDRFDPAGLRIEFSQLAGDVETFDGVWQSVPCGGGTRVVFTAMLDLGIPTLADVLEPIAVSALVENTVSILRGLFGDAVEVEDPAAAEVVQ
jgi:hypothetical protein